MRILATIRIALRALRRNKLRSALTTLGIIIGGGAVIAMVSIGNGAKAQVEAQIASLGQNVIHGQDESHILQVFGYLFDLPFLGLGPFSEKIPQHRRLPADKQSLDVMLGTLVIYGKLGAGNHSDADSFALCHGC